MTDLLELKHGLFEEAHRLGFDEVGVAVAGPADPAGHFQRWLDAGRHAGMEYLANRAEERKDPSRIVAEARSVVILTTYYLHQRPPPERGTARVSRYAWSRDYHRVVTKRLRKLRRWLGDQVPGAGIYTEVDTGPVLEKVWAQRAGLGWIGKHGNLISRRRSSWIFLAALITDVALPPDEPHADHCGTCDRCIRACPTSAIVTPGVVDSSRCISYHTIEHRNVVPEPLRPGHGTWLFGCDDCQEVCPWNKFAREPGDPEFASRPGHSDPDPTEILALDDQAFRVRFEGTVLMRAGRVGLARSAAMVLGNLGDRSAVPALDRALQQDPAKPVRAHAAWALGRLGGEKAIAALEAARWLESEPAVVAEIEAAVQAARNQAPRS